MKFINVTGYVSSGSSAVIDYIREFDGTAVCESEIRFIRDPFGIIDLDVALNYNWENERSSYIVWKFLDRAKLMARYNRHVWSPMGHSYAKLLNKDYLKITNEYIEEMTDYKTIFSRYCDNYDYSYFSYVINRVRRNIEKRTSGKFNVASRRVRKNYFIHPTEEQFIECTKRYLERLFGEISNNGEKTVILDHALPPNLLNYVDRYFDDCTTIIVDRDPRDIYVTQIISTDVIAKQKGTKESGEMFVKYYKTLKEKETRCNKILRIQFEDLILNYEKTAEVLNHFLDLKGENHKEKNKFLKPEVSCKNVGIWKKYYDKYKGAIDYIYQELKDSCYNLD